MKRSMEIPSMCKSDIINLYQKIHPIVRRKMDGELYFLRKLTDVELGSISLVATKREVDYAQIVPSYKMQFLADVQMLHRWIHQGVFSPTVEEVICQIPKNFIDEVIAFEVIWGPKISSDFSLFQEEFNNGFHVSVVRLYKLRDNAKGI